MKEEDDKEKISTQDIHDATQLSDEEDLSNTFVDALAEERELLRDLTTENEDLVNQLKQNENEAKTQEILYLNSLKLACMQ